MPAIPAKIYTKNPPSPCNPGAGEGISSPFQLSALPRPSPWAAQSRRTPELGTVPRHAAGFSSIPRENRALRHAMKPQSRGTGCVNCARPDQWGASSGLRPGGPIPEAIPIPEAASQTPSPLRPSATGQPRTSPRPERALFAPASRATWFRLAPSRRGSFIRVTGKSIIK
jgi:hypothetical protein